jgi:hypothetical protein
VAPAPRRAMTRAIARRSTRDDERPGGT